MSKKPPRIPPQINSVIYPPTSHLFRQLARERYDLDDQAFAEALVNNHIITVRLSEEECRYLTRYLKNHAAALARQGRTTELYVALLIQRLVGQLSAPQVRLTDPLLIPESQAEKFIDPLTRKDSYEHS